MSSINPKWKKFEKLVAALHIAEQKGAIVKWNDEFDGRQFDVTIRFKNGFYDYLTVVECKDYINPVSVDKVEAFITKSRDIKSDKAVIVSASGFQKGAIQVAQKHNVSLFTLKSLSTLADNKVLESLSPLLLLYFFRFKVTDKDKIIVIPEEIGILRSLLRSIKIIIENEVHSPEEIINNYRTEATNTASVIPQKIEIAFPPKTILIHPNTLQKTLISSFLFNFCIISQSQLTKKTNLGIDPYLSDDIYKFTDEIKGESQFVDSSKFELGFDTVLVEGKFYKNPHLGFSYFCLSVSEDEIKLCLVESYQSGKLMQRILIINPKLGNICQYVEITDKTEILRLKKLYEEYQKHFDNSESK